MVQSLNVAEVRHATAFRAFVQEHLEAAAGQFNLDRLEAVSGSVVPLYKWVIGVNRYISALSEMQDFEAQEEDCDFSLATARAGRDTASKLLEEHKERLSKLKVLYHKTAQRDAQIHAELQIHLAALEH
jgi:hypothetical protein